MFAVSCRKVSHNGDLDGQWQMMSIEAADGSVRTVSGIYYNFMLHTAQLRSNKSSTPRTANLTYDKNKSLLLEFPMNTADDFDNYGLSSADFSDADEKGVRIKFIVSHITSHDLILTTPTATILTFRKF